MPANSRRAAANAVGKGKGDLPCSVKVRQGMAAMRAIQLIDSRAWRASQGAPFQFARWLAALATVLIDWVQSGTPQSAVAYLPVLTVVTLLLLPDAESIGVGSLRFERLTSEVGRQKQGVRPEHELQTVQMVEQDVSPVQVAHQSHGGPLYQLLGRCGRSEPAPP